LRSKIKGSCDGVGFVLEKLAGIEVKGPKVGGRGRKSHIVLANEKASLKIWFGRYQSIVGVFRASQTSKVCP
jgi:hypothetical protein